MRGRRVICRRIYARRGWRWRARRWEARSLGPRQDLEAARCRDSVLYVSREFRRPLEVQVDAGAPGLPAHAILDHDIELPPIEGAVSVVHLSLAPAECDRSLPGISLHRLHS